MHLLLLPALCQLAHPERRQLLFELERQDSGLCAAVIRSLSASPLFASSTPGLFACPARPEIREPWRRKIDRPGRDRVFSQRPPRFQRIRMKPPAVQPLRCDSRRRTRPGHRPRGRESGPLLSPDRDSRRRRPQVRAGLLECPRPARLRGQLLPADQGLPIRTARRASSRRPATAPAAIPASARGATGRWNGVGKGFHGLCVCPQPQWTVPPLPGGGACHEAPPLFRKDLLSLLLLNVYHLPAV